MTGEERRGALRSAVQSYRVLSGEVDLEDGKEPCCFILEDVSLEGLRILSDRLFPEGRPFLLTIFLSEPWTGRVGMAWHREAGSGLHAMGLHCLDISPEDRPRHREFLVRQLPENRRGQPRLGKVLKVEVLPGPEETAFNAFTLDLSSGGIQILHDRELPEEQELHLVLHLYPGHPIAEKGRVAWQRQEGPDQYRIGVRFEGTEQDTTLRLGRYIRSALSQELEWNRSLNPP